MALNDLKYKYDVIIYCGCKCGSCTLLKTFTNANYNVLHTAHLACRYPYQRRW